MTCVPNDDENDYQLELHSNEVKLAKFRVHVLTCGIKLS